MELGLATSCAICFINVGTAKRKERARPEDVDSDDLFGNAQ